MSYESHMIVDDPRHDVADTAELIEGFEVYFDDEADAYVAACPDVPISSFGDTKGEAVANAKNALELYEDGEDGVMHDRALTAEQLETYKRLVIETERPLSELDTDAIYKDD